ncbi:hypothetical protein JNUCC31_25195 [Paenibacillus sp. JNUCC31]|uniref:stalk domain-containing protein n=1 Tax=Paenibacillus sp. JNUCC-31 TaxID=2777983 RepID=UPI001784515A|nr:stalk domain-containing protein [Paenibacillus sp. JNUCC-31]QOS77961.1 hypothetical protein JNUCC31_24955 [Paenibacillus sp. JNUCC-31]QOS78005.1 hypothetical protein JNUCC31_25195 [Paenibacillus sp. JNUCC-31]
MKKTLVKTVVTLGIGMMIGSATLAAAAPSTIQAVISNFKVVVNNEQASLKNAPIVSEGVTYLPVREVASLLDAEVKYDSKNKQININSKGDDTLQPTATVTEWVPAKEAVSKYGISINISDVTTVSLNDKEIVFPLSMYDQKEGVKTVKNETETATLKIDQNELYFGDDTLKLLGVQ